MKWTGWSDGASSGSVEDDIPLTELARETGTALRTLQRWYHRYRTGGMAALEPRPRKDALSRRTPEELVVFVERIALTRLRPSIATLHRLTVTEAARLDYPPPSYATVRSIVGALDPALVALALEAAYRDRHELVFRHRAEKPNATWQADHTELDILITGADGKPERPWSLSAGSEFAAGGQRYPNYVCTGSRFWPVTVTPVSGTSRYSGSHASAGMDLISAPGRRTDTSVRPESSARKTVNALTLARCSGVTPVTSSEATGAAIPARGSCTTHCLEPSVRTTT